MKPIFLFCILLQLLSTRAHAQLKLGDNPTTINSNSLLELEHTSKGLLLPRLSLSSTTSFSPLSAHIAGMIVYNIAAANDVTPGYYFNDGSAWIRIGTNGDEPWRNAVTLTAATNNSTNIVYNNGYVGIATTAPQTSLHVLGNNVTGPTQQPYRAGIVAEAEGNNVGGRIASKTASAFEVPTFAAYRSRGGFTSPSAVLAGDRLLDFTVNGYTGTDWSVSHAPISIVAEQDWTATANGYSITFNTVSNDFTFRNEVMRVSNNGNVGIGTATPSSKLSVAGGIEITTGSLPPGQSASGFSMSHNGVNFGSYRTEFVNYRGAGTGGFYFYSVPAATTPTGSGIANINATTGAYSATSDRRVKTDLQDLQYGINTIMKLRPVSYLHHKDSWIDKGITHQSAEGNRAIGFIAQEMYKEVPELVNKPTDDSKEFWSMNYAGLTTVLTKAVQEQQQQLEDQRKELELLKKEIIALKKSHR